MGIALWIVPPLAEVSKLNQLMRVPPLLRPLDYPVPSFEPHITLASFPSTTPVASLRSAVESVAPRVCTEASSLPIAFTALCAGDHFFRSVFVDVLPTPALETLRSGVHRAVEQSLGRAVDARSPRFPHLSLFYIPDEHAEDRVRIRNALWQTFGICVGENGNQLIAFHLSGSKSDMRSEFILESFMASDVWIVRCEGPVDDWEVLDKVFIGTPI